MYAPPEVYGLVATIPPSAYCDMPTTLASITQSYPSTKTRWNQSVSAAGS